MILRHGYKHLSRLADQPAQHLVRWGTTRTAFRCKQLSHDDSMGRWSWQAGMSPRIASTGPRSPDLSDGSPGEDASNAKAHNDNGNRALRVHAVFEIFAERTRKVTRLKWQNGRRDRRHPPG